MGSKVCLLYNLYDEYLRRVERLKIHVDKMVGRAMKKLIVTHILNSPVVIYIDDKYYPNRYVEAIRSYYGKVEAKNYLINRNEWLIKTIDNIVWEVVNKVTNKLIYAKRKKTIKISHRWLSSKSKHFSNSIICPYCKFQDSANVDHDYF